MTRFRIIYQHSNIEAPQGRFDIGRSLECHLVLDDPSVSRVHATIVRNNDELVLEDRGSRNGCTLNGNPVTGVVQLADGDVIGIGHQSIRISAISNLKHQATNTMGLMACPNCSKWISMGDDFCTNCGTPMGASHTRPSDTAQIDLPIKHKESDTNELPTLNSGDMLAGLAQKALSKNRFEEAWKFTRRLMETITASQSPLRAPSESELEKVADLIVDLALSSREPARITDLFVFFTQMRRLLPRKTVDHLYAVARSTGYRTSSELHQYIACLAELTGSYSPGEKFIFRRIEGLVGLCN